MSSSGTRNRRSSIRGARPAVQSVLRRLRQPSYVGENRCIPCTLLNCIVAAVLSMLIAGVNPLAGITAFTIALAVIYLRGYLVPLTPVLMSGLFAPGLHSGSARRTSGQERTRQEGPATVEPAAVLRDAGAIQSCEADEDLCLRIDFKRDLYTTITRLTAEENRLDLFAELGLDAADIDIVGYGDAFAAFDGEQHLGQWASRAAFLADVAGARVLSQRYEGWADLSLLDRGAVLSALRLFLTECPACGGRVRFGRATVESSTRNIEVVAVACESCHSRLFEQSLGKLRTEDAVVGKAQNP